MKWTAMEQAMQEPAGIAIKDSFAATILQLRQHRQSTFAT